MYFIKLQRIIGQTMPNELTFKPIGYFSTEEKDPYNLPRQPGLTEYKNHGKVVLDKEISASAIEDLGGFSKVWLIFAFDRNTNWKPKVLPPRGNKKVSVLATRSPHRPNPIGMSCVDLLEVKSNEILVGSHDLLDQTPILDIKPYIPEYDSFSDETTGWLEPQEQYGIEFSQDAKLKSEWIEQHTHLPIQQTIETQLSTDPKNSKRKRIKDCGDHYVLSIKTWRFKYQIEDNRTIILDASSGYSEAEMNDPTDPYQDIEIHQRFKSKFA